MIPQYKLLKKRIISANDHGTSYDCMNHIYTKYTKRLYSRAKDYTLYNPDLDLRATNYTIRYMRRHENEHRN